MLLATMERLNAACDWLAEKAFVGKFTTDRKLRDKYYHELREKFGLSSQMVGLACSKVISAYKRDLSKRPRFRKHGAFPYDSRVLSFHNGDIVSILTLEGREDMFYLAGDYQRLQLLGKRGESKLVYRKGEFYLHVSVETFESEPIEAKHWLGVDLGIVNLATDSDGKHYSGAGVEKVRVRTMRLKSALQSRGTRSAKRHLKDIGKREANYRADVNHCISKALVKTAQGTDRGIALEDLSGIRDRVTVRHDQRARLGSWGFLDLRQKITYKAVLAGVEVRVVDPRNTSRTCLNCPCDLKENRKSQAEFVCKKCGFAANADYVGAVNIARKAAVNQPIVSGNDRGKRDARRRKSGTSRSSDASSAL